VWVAKVAFLVVVALVLIERVVAHRKLRAQFEAEEAQIAEGKV
jgi:membrane protein YdbS with pleckstrin-like domain